MTQLILKASTKEVNKHFLHFLKLFLLRVISNKLYASKNCALRIEISSDHIGIIFTCYFRLKSHFFIWITTHVRFNYFLKQIFIIRDHFCRLLYLWRPASGSTCNLNIIEDLGNRWSLSAQSTLCCLSLLVSGCWTPKMRWRPPQSVSPFERELGALLLITILQVFMKWLWR